MRQIFSVGKNSLFFSLRRENGGLTGEDLNLPPALGFVAKIFVQRDSRRGRSGVRIAGADVSGGRYRIRTYDFHRVKMALYR